MNDKIEQFVADMGDDTRFIAVRETDGDLWLDMTHEGDTAEEAMQRAKICDAHELGPQWAAENKLIGVAVVKLAVLGLLTPASSLV